MSAVVTPVNDHPEPGLRELKKQMTRETIATNAFRLVAQHGLDNVTIEEIARLSLVAPRTFSNYFSCKEEAVLSSGGDDVQPIVDQLAQRPADEPVLTALREALLGFISSRTAEQLENVVRKMELVQEYPSLRPFYGARFDELEEALRSAVAERTGSDVGRDVYPWLAAAAAAASLRSAMLLWARAGARRARLSPLVQEAFDLFGDGLPAPRKG